MGIATQEVHQWVIEAYRSGKGTQQPIADLFGIDLRTFVLWWEQYRHHGQLAPLPRGHNSSALNEKEMQAPDRLIKKRSDVTLAYCFSRNWTILCSSSPKRVTKSAAFSNSD